MPSLRTLLGLDQPQETRFFLFLAAFGFAITAVYFFWSSYEPAGTALLLGFSAANATVGIRLAIDPGATAVRRRVRDGTPHLEPERRDFGGGGTGGIDRPFLDEEGRLPEETLAPFAVGLGLAIAATSPVFGAITLVVGLLPLAWGGWMWLVGSNDELDAVERAELITGRARAHRPGGPPDRPGGPPGGG
jgi:hypothetical protein